MPGVSSIAMISVRTTILTSWQKLSCALEPNFHNFFIIHTRKKLLHQNDVEFDFSIGHGLVIFMF